MQATLTEWSNISSYSHDLVGLSEMLKAVRVAFAPLQAKEEVIEFSPKEVWTLEGKKERKVGPSLCLTKRPTAPLQVYLGGHFDTVYKEGWEVTQKGDRLYGPGVADMKGGLVVMLEALRELEEEGGDHLGWTVLLNSDEEWGSIASRSLIEERAKGCHLGLLFEPTLPDGSFVSERKGSFNGLIQAQGKASHVGRTFDEGKSAIVALADCIATLPTLKGVQFNVGQIVGGSAPNIVPANASCTLNIRHEKPFANALEHHLEKIAGKHGVILTLHPLSERPYKPISKEMERLMGALIAQDESIHWQKTGGVCDGNLVAAQGVPCVDTLGVQGGNLHTREEYCEVSSLLRQSTLAASLLLKLSSGEIKWEHFDTMR